MKSLALTLFTFVSCYSFSQDIYTTYRSPLDHKVYNIYLDKDEELSILVDAFSVDPLGTKGGIVLKKEDLSSFIDNLRIAHDKYIEWTNIARVNSVTDLSKDLDLPIHEQLCYFIIGNEWHLAYCNELNYKYIIMEMDGETTYTVGLYTGLLQASDNEYMDHEGFIIVFYSAAEIEEFISLLDIDKINEYIEKKSSTESLFK